VRRVLLVAVVIAISLLAAGCRDVPKPFYGITFDNDNGASTATLNAQADVITHLPHTPMVRVVIDPDSSPSDYSAAFARFQPIAYTMAELVDSSSIPDYTLSEYAAHADLFADALAGPPGEGTDPVDFWEVGNEVNGNWTGTPSVVAQKVLAALDVVQQHVKRSALTLWENNWGTNHCGNGSGELTPQQWSALLTAEERAKFQMVTVSWYPTQCSGKPNGNSNLIPAATIKAEMESLKGLYPNALIGFGEIGLPNPVTSGTLASAQAIASYYYGLGDLGHPDWYIGGYYWWYGASDMCCP